MEDMYQICAVAVADFAPWTCPRCESINSGTNHCEVCDEPKLGRNIDIEDEIFDVESEPVIDIEDEVFDVESERFEYTQLALL